MPLTLITSGSGSSASATTADRTVYLRDYGAVYGGTGDNAQAFADAATAMIAQGRTRLHIGEGDVRVTVWPTSLNAVNRLALVGDHPEASRIMVAGWSGVSAFIRPTGTMGTPVNLTANANQGASTLAMTTTGIVAGDTLLVGADTGFSVENPTRYKGEQVRVKSIDSATQLTIHGYLQDTYTTAALASAQRVTPLIGLYLSNFSLVNTAPGTNTAKGIELTAAQRFHIDDVHTEGLDGAGVTLTNCLDGSTKTQHRDHTDDSANNRFGYGLALSRSTQNVTCDVTARNCRHAFTADGIDGLRGLPRSFTVAGVAEACPSGAWDTHSASAGGVFKNVIARNCGFLGIQLRGKNMRVLGADIEFCQGGIVLSDDASGAYIGGGTTIRDIQELASYGSGIRLGAAPDVTIDSFQIERTARRGIHIAGAAPRLKIRNGVITNTGVANVSGFKSAIATDSGLTLASSGLEVERMLLVRDSAVAPNMDFGIRQNSTGWTGGRFADIVSHNVTALLDSATVPSQRERVYRLDENTPADFTANGLTHKLKTGLPVDADWPIAPPNGTEAINSRSGRRSRRIAGVWKEEPVHANDFWMPTSALAETFSRRGARSGDNLALLNSGRLHLCGGMVIPSDKTISNLVAYAGTTAVATPTNQWFCLVDAVALTILAITVDDTTAAWAANAKKSLALAATYTPTADLPVYFGIMVAATTVPTLLGSAQSASTVVAEGRAMVGASTTGLTTPPAVGTTVAGPASGQVGLPYCYCT